MEVRELEPTSMHRVSTSAVLSSGSRLEVEGMLYVPPQPIPEAFRSLGTGGMVTKNHLWIISGTGTQGIEGYRPTRQVGLTNAVLDVPNQLSLIKDSFSLSITDLSKVLLVERPTVYSWLDGIPPRDANQVRINSLKKAAEKWNSSCSDPVGKYLKAISFQESSIFDILCEDPLQEMVLSQAIEITADKVKSDIEKKQVSSLSTKLKSKGFAKPSRRAREFTLKSATRVYLPNSDE